MTAGTSDTSVTVVVVTWQGRHLVGACLESLRAQTLPHRLVVVDNASTDGTAAFLAAEHPEATVVTTSENLGFAGGVQAGLDVVDTPYAALLNNDAQADPGWLEALVGHLEARPEAAAVTSRMVLADRPGVLNNTGVLLLPGGYGADRGYGEPEGDRPDPEEVFGFSGGAAALRMAAVRQVGGFARRFFLYYEDTDLSWRLRLAGWTIRYEPRAVVRHLHSATVDQQSETFAFHNERNRLLTLLRCAPAGTVLSATARFLLTTASLVVRRAVGQQVPDVPTFRPRVRLQAFGSFLRLAPWALRHRRAIAGAAIVPLREITARWTTAAG